MRLAQSFAKALESRPVRYLVLVCGVALPMVCVLLWLVPAARTPGTHAALSALTALVLLQYAHRYGLLTKTLPQLYQSYRHRAVPAFGRYGAVLFFAVVTDLAWKVMW